MIILNLFFQVQSSDVESEEKRHTIVRHPQQVPEQVEQSKQPIEENTEGENPRPTITKDDSSFEIHSSDDGRGKKLPHYGQKRFKKRKVPIVSIEFSNKNPISRFIMLY